MAYLIKFIQRGKSIGISRGKQVSKTNLCEMIVKIILNFYEEKDLSRKINLSALACNISARLANEYKVEAEDSEILTIIHNISYWRNPIWDKKKKKQPAYIDLIVKIPKIILWI